MEPQASYPSQSGRSRFIIGRHPDNDIVISDPSVSMRHCFILIQPDGSKRLVDMGSTNGVAIFEGGAWKRVTDAPISQSDRVCIGSYETDVMSLMLQLQQLTGLRNKQKIFVSYRRSDTEHVAGRLFDRLAAKYGAGDVFFDTEAIPGAVEFRSRIAAAVEESAVVLALIGPDWMRPHKTSWLGRWMGRAREDFIENELSAALSAMVPVVPVLTGSTAMPLPSALPRALARVTSLNAMRVRAGRDFHADVDALMEVIDRYRAAPASSPPLTPSVGPTPPPPPPIAS